MTTREDDIIREFIDMLKSLKNVEVGFSNKPVSTNNTTDPMTKLKGIVDLYKEKKIPESIPKELLNSFEVRDIIIKCCGFSVVTMNWIRVLANHLNGKKGLEIMAGKGTLSKVIAVTA